MDTNKVSAILSQLGGNPFNTPVGQKIEHATDTSLASENWALNMEICDFINDTDEGPKDAVKAIRKRLQQNAGKNYTVVMYTLTVLETCVKNCGRRFHLLITQKDFVQDLVKLIGPKNDPPTIVQEKVLSLIQSWADAFRAIPEMQGVVQVYNDLKQKGIEFPMTDLDAMAPIHTPQRSVPVPEVHPHRTDRVLPQEPNLTVPPSQQPVATGPVSLTPEQLAKLRSELDIVQANMKVFGEMLTELVPGKEHPSDLELLNDLRQTCHAMQSRVVQLIDNVANEEVTSELLRVNDEMNNLFLRYERFDKKRSSMNIQVPKQTIAPVVESKPLIDLGDDTKTDDIQVQLANMSLGSSTATSALGQLTSVSAAAKPLDGSDEFDMFAQSRNVTYEQAKSSGSTYADNSSGDQVSGLRSIAAAKGQSTKEEADVDFLQKLQREQDFDEMERWLDHKPTSGQDSITSSEFDRFLAERAAAAETVPTTTTATTTSSATTTPSRQSGGNPQNRRRINHEEPENTLFAL